MIKTGDQAPDFELSDHEGTPVRLSGLRGTPVVLYLYPKAVDNADSARPGGVGGAPGVGSSLHVPCRRRVGRRFG